MTRQEKDPKDPITLDISPESTLVIILLLIFIPLILTGFLSQ